MRMFRQKTGSVVCASCGSLVGVNDDRCYSCGRRNPGLWGFGPVLRRFGNDFGFTVAIMYGCAGLFALSLLLTVLSGGSLTGGSIFSILGPNQYALDALGAAGGLPVFGEGRWWTLLSAGWLHGGALHILFNMMWVRQLGPIVADMYGGARMVIIYTISSVLGFLLSSFLGAHGVPFSGAYYTLGASAPIFGLLGALLHYGHRGGSSLVRSQAISWAVPIFLFGFFMGGVDNAAHLGGFVGGYIASKWLDPLKPERMDHFVGAAVCLLATVASIVVSLVMFLPALFSYLANR
ncbi:MAG TPA: rhomboid family intramembrane serine protease [Vicinamibacterales bacterium]|nr:rhomboid family intramembrane serine protease [Vicinamibacterales bacterium]